MELNLEFVKATLNDGKPSIKNYLYHATHMSLLTFPQFPQDSCDINLELTAEQVLQSDDPVNPNLFIEIVSGAGTSRQTINEYQLVTKLGGNQFVVRDPQGYEYEVQCSHYSIFSKD